MTGPKDAESRITPWDLGYYQHSSFEVEDMILESGLDNRERRRFPIGSVEFYSDGDKTVTAFELNPLISPHNWGIVRPSDLITEYVLAADVMARYRTGEHQEYSERRIPRVISIRDMEFKEPLFAVGGISVNVAVERASERDSLVKVYIGEDYVIAEGFVETDETMVLDSEGNSLKLEDRVEGKEKILSFEQADQKLEEMGYKKAKRFPFEFYRNSDGTVEAFLQAMEKYCDPYVGFTTADMMDAFIQAQLLRKEREPGAVAILKKIDAFRLGFIRPFPGMILKMEFGEKDGSGILIGQRALSPEVASGSVKTEFLPFEQVMEERREAVKRMLQSEPIFR